jgi:hypothetical protein
LIDQANQLQAQLAAQEKEQSVGYAPVYYPGTTIPASATTVALNVGEERAGVDFQLQLVATAIVSGTVVSPDGRVPQGTQITLRAAAACWPTARSPSRTCRPASTRSRLAR